MITLARMIFPFSLPSYISFYNFIDLPSNQSAENTLALKPFSANANINAISPLAIIWVVGFLVISIFFFTSYFKHIKLFKTVKPVKNTIVKSWLKKKKIKNRIRIMVSESIDSPLSYGIFRPVILLPKSILIADGDDLDYILAHEYTHIKHGDLILKLILTCVLCFYWFNPLVWAMYILANRDMELHCDETVINTIGGHKSKYASLLISLAEKKILPSMQFADFSSMKERIISILTTRKKSITAILTSVIIILVCGTVFASTKIENGLVILTDQNMQQDQEEQPTMDSGISYIPAPIENSKTGSQPTSTPITEPVEAPRKPAETSSQDQKSQEKVETETVSPPNIDNDGLMTSYATETLSPNQFQ